MADDLSAYVANLTRFLELSLKCGITKYRVGDTSNHSEWNIQDLLCKIKEKPDMIKLHTVVRLKCHNGDWHRITPDRICFATAILEEFSTSPKASGKMMPEMELRKQGFIRLLTKFAEACFTSGRHLIEYAEDGQHYKTIDIQAFYHLVVESPWTIRLSSCVKLGGRGKPITIANIEKVIGTIEAKTAQAE